MNEIEKQKLLKDLNDLNKGLINYKKRQERRGGTKLSEAQKKNLNFLRLRLRDKYSLNKKAISEYGGDVSIKIRGINWDLFIYSLRSQNMDPDQFTALDRAINMVNGAIKNIESIVITTIDWRDISIPQRKETRADKISYSLDLMQLHPRIIEASKSLFETGHYTQAIFEAFKTVNNFVKEKTVLSLDGKALMSKVFNENAPIIKLNELSTQSDRDEQEGFKFLFMGAMVGIRNPKAHNNVIQTDPYRTLEYLGFASLLMKRVEEGKVAPVQKNVQTV